MKVPLIYTGTPADSSLPEKYQETVVSLLTFCPLMTQLLQQVLPLQEPANENKEEPNQEGTSELVNTTTKY